MEFAVEREIVPVIDKDALDLLVVFHSFHYWRVDFDLSCEESENKKIKSNMKADEFLANALESRRFKHLFEHLGCQVGKDGNNGENKADLFVRIAGIEGHVEYGDGQKDWELSLLPFFLVVTVTAKNENRRQ
jgi:hypothetical protein